MPGDVTIGDVRQLVSRFDGLGPDLDAPGRMLLFHDRITAAKIAYKPGGLDAVGFVSSKFKTYDIFFCNDALVMGKAWAGILCTKFTAHAFPITECNLWRRPDSEQLALEHPQLLRLRCHGVVGPARGAAPHEREYVIACAGLDHMQRVYGRFQAIRNPLVAPRDRQPMLVPIPGAASAKRQGASSSPPPNQEAPPHPVVTTSASATATSLGQSVAGAGAMPAAPAAAAELAAVPVAAAAMTSRAPLPSHFPPGPAAIAGAGTVASSPAAFTTASTGGGFALGGSQSVLPPTAAVTGQATHLPPLAPTGTKLRAHVMARQSVGVAGFGGGSESVGSASTRRGGGSESVASSATPKATAGGGGPDVDEALRSLEARLRASLSTAAAAGGSSDGAPTPSYVISQAQAQTVAPLSRSGVALGAEVVVSSLPSVPPMPSIASAPAASSPAPDATDGADEAAARHRHYIYAEILDSEKRYVTDLQIVRKHYLLPLRGEVASAEPILSEATLGAMFANIEVILDVNASLLLAICRRMSGSTNVGGDSATQASAGLAPMLSEVFADAFTTVMPFLRVYSTYCKNYWAAADILRSQAAGNARLQDFLHAQSLRPEVAKRDLASFLIKPVQRICKYPLFFNDLIKHMPAWHPNRPMMVKALEEVERIAAGVNERLQAEERQQRILDVYDLIDRAIPDLIQPHRVLLLDMQDVELSFPFGAQSGAGMTAGGSSFMELLSWATGSGGARSYRVFLLSDLLLVTRFSHTGAAFADDATAAAALEDDPYAGIGADGSAAGGPESKHLPGSTTNQRYKLLERLDLKDVTVADLDDQTQAAATAASVGKDKSPDKLRSVTRATTAGSSSIEGSLPSLVLTATKPTVSADGTVGTAVLRCRLHFRSIEMRDEAHAELARAAAAALDAHRSLQSRKESANPQGTRAWKKAVNAKGAAAGGGRPSTAVGRTPSGRGLAGPAADAAADDDAEEHV